jgi:hypothetical protein
MKKSVGQAPTAGEQTQQNRVGRLPTSERSRKIILSDEVRCRIGNSYETATAPSIELLGYTLYEGETAGEGKQGLSSPKYPEKPYEHSNYSFNGSGRIFLLEVKAAGA